MTHTDRDTKGGTIEQLGRLIADYEGQLIELEARAPGSVRGDLSTVADRWGAEWCRASLNRTGKQLASCKSDHEVLLVLASSEREVSTEARTGSEVQVAIQTRKAVELSGWYFFLIDRALRRVFTGMEPVIADSDPGPTEGDALDWQEEVAAGRTKMGLIEWFEQLKAELGSDEVQNQEFEEKLEQGG